MNVTELARILKITPQELKDSLPQLGFDIGQKAIKINRNVANKIIKEWPILRKQLAHKKAEAEKLAQEKKAGLAKENSRKVAIANVLTVRDFANVLNQPINIILAELMKNGIFASLNEKIDYDTAWLVGSELGYEISKKDENDQVVEEENKLKEILKTQDKNKMFERPPVIVVMGHVDHGKTKLLDAVRKTDVVAREAGGITQHIGAYQVSRKGQAITFIDTPGHEAFTAMRGRGAKIADIAILVVAADDGVKPQTVEAFRIIEAAKIPYVVAINKIDKEAANIDKTKQELSSQLNIIPEDWGGKVTCAPISALRGKGIDELLDMVLLTAEAEAENLKANPEAGGLGTIIESHVDKGAGPVATILVQNGTLRVGDPLSLEGVNLGKVRSLIDYRGETISEAGPATPAQIIGFKTLPQVGDMIEVGIGQKIKHKKIKSVARGGASNHSSITDDDASVAKINLIIKSDVLGSAEAIEESLEKINTKKAKVKIIKKGLGNITDGDIKQSEATGADIIGFNVKIPTAIEEMAREKNVNIKMYSIIYDLINDIKEKIKEVVKVEYEKKEVGRFKVMAIFRSEKESQIVGGKVIDGVLEPGAMAEIFRNDEFYSDGAISKVQSGKEEITIAEKDQECGMEFKGRPVIQEGDIIKIFKEVEVED